MFLSRFGSSKRETASLCSFMGYKVVSHQSWRRYEKKLLLGPMHTARGWVRIESWTLVSSAKFDSPPLCSPLSTLYYFNRKNTTISLDVQHFWDRFYSLKVTLFPLCLFTTCIMISIFRNCIQVILVNILIWCTSF